MYITLPPLKEKRKVYEINLSFCNIIYIHVHVYDTLTEVLQRKRQTQILVISD